METIMEKIEDLYFSVQVAEKTFIGRIDYGRYGIELSRDKSNKIVINCMSDGSPFIALEEAMILVPIRTEKGPETLPVRFTEMPTGSSKILIRTDSIAVINAIDPNAPIVNVLRSLEANLIVSATQEDVQNSSKIISKFGKR